MPLRIKKAEQFLKYLTIGIRHGDIEGIINETNWYLYYFW